jgi:predicted nucleic acid-binding protein
MLRVFLDANVYFAGCVSREGASALVLHLARGGRVRVVASRLVLREADRNLRRKSTRSAHTAFRRFVAGTDLTVVPAPPDTTLAQYEAAIHPKDVPVLAAAMEAKVDYLVTLDRRHFFTKAVLSRARGVRIVTPGDFLKELRR